MRALWKDFVRAPLSALMLLMCYTGSLLALLVGGDVVLGLLWLVFAGQVGDRRERYVKGLGDDS